tara:strand:+ start:93 stop:314 length:222 start_codon:yes stop_codon:yes gene_type:complete
MAKIETEQQVPEAEISRELKTNYIGFKIEDSLKDRIKSVAKKQRRSISSQICYYVEKCLEEEEKFGCLSREAV